MARRRQEPDYGFPPARGGRGAPSMFPRKLFQILCETDPAVVGWDSDGMSFHIANFEEFVEGVMPMFYRHNKLTSFQRQLNLYGFKKMGRDEKYPGHYYHPYFQRDHPEILGGVRRSYPVTSPKWEDDDGGATPRDEAAVTASSAAAAAGSRGSSASPRRKRAAHSPTPDMDAEHMSAVRKESLASQQQQQQQHRARCAEAAAAAGRVSSSASPAFDDRMQDEPGYPVGGPTTAKRPWFHSSSPAAASDAATAAAAAAAKWTNQKRTVKTEVLLDASLTDSWTAAGRAAAYSSSSSSRSGVPAVGGPVEALPRHAVSHHPATDGRHWGGGAYRDQEDSYPAGGGRWYDSEESGLSRLTSCDSSSSAWDEMKQPGGGGDFYDRNRSSGSRAATATVTAAGIPVGAEGDPRRIRYSPDEGEGGGGGSAAGGVGGRSLNAHPVHRTVPTSAMFPAHFLRHDRFGRYQGHSYPPPPMFLPAHSYPNPDAVPLKASRWRPVYGDGGSSGGGGGGSSHDNSSSVDGWGGPKRLAADGQGAAEWSAAAYSQDKETATLPAEAEARRKARDAGGSQSNGQQPGARLEGEGGPGDLSRPPPSSSYRAACDEFLGDDDADGADRGKAARFRFPLPKSSPAAAVATGGGGGAQPPAREDSVGTRRRALAASV